MVKVGDQVGNTTVIAVDEVAGIVVWRRKGTEGRCPISEWDAIVSPVEAEPADAAVDPSPAPKRKRKKPALATEG